MNDKDFKNQLERYRRMTQENLPSAYPSIQQEHGVISEAARYSLLAGGKRIRPALCFSVSEMIDLPLSDVMAFACAIEMIHTYSLIHDDLPCMDNDDFRRGKPTCHKVYGEAIALLAGDALLNKAFENLSEACVNANQRNYAAAMAYLCRASGDRGMIGGQILDLISQNTTISVEQLQMIHAMKTGAMIRACVMLPVIIKGAEEPLYGLIEEYASLIGIIFQIRDDILDVTASSEVLGKTAGKDEKAKKATYVSLLGLQEASRCLIQTGDHAQKLLSDIRSLGYDIDFLRKLTYYLVDRNH